MTEPPSLTEAEIAALRVLLEESYWEDEVGLYIWGEKGEAAVEEARRAMMSLVRRGYIDVYEASWRDPAPARRVAPTHDLASLGVLETSGPLPQAEALKRLEKRAEWGTGDQRHDIAQPHLRVLATDQGRRAFQSHGAIGNHR
jgi:hypothetical protein